MKINDKGFWMNRTNEGHGVDPLLADALVSYFSSYEYNIAISVIDIGCGTGFYTKRLLNSGIYCRGYDGNPFTVELSDGICEVCDFSVPVNISPADWSLCLEVGEHIPVEYEQVFLDNVSKLSRIGCIISWAIEGQGGDGHVNCRNNDYIISEMKKRNFRFLDNHTQILRNKSAKYPNTGWWFRNTLMVFMR